MLKMLMDNQIKVIRHDSQYTCASSRAVILDLIPGMGPPVSKQSIKRFISRRGCSRMVLQHTLSALAWRFLRTSYSHSETIT